MEYEHLAEESCPCGPFRLGELLIHQDAAVPVGHAVALPDQTVKASNRTVVAAQSTRVEVP